MPNINELLNHDVQVNRLENNAIRSYITPSLGETLREVRRLLADVEDIRTLRELRALERAIEEVIRSQTGWATLTDELLEFADYENQFITSWTAAGTQAATAASVQRLADRTLMVLRSGDRYDSGLWRDFVDGNIDSQIRRVNAIVRSGYANGTTARELRAAVSRLYDGTIAREADALVRTAYNHHGTIGRRAFAEANKDIIKREVPLVTFDARTSDTCISIGARYGQSGWPYGESPIGYAPYHWNCRTTIIFLTRNQKSIEGFRVARGAEGGSRIPASTTITEFFRSQPRSWLDEVLGPERAKLFVEVKLELRNLTSANLTPRTLKQLRGD